MNRGEFGSSSEADKERIRKGGVHAMRACVYALLTRVWPFAEREREMAALAADAAEKKKKFEEMSARDQRSFTPEEVAR